jgi:hypothetical protein
MTRDEKIVITKLEAAERQLDCAIELWFRDADQVSIHTLARAAYDIIHDINEHRGMPRDLLYNSDLVKDEYQSQWRASIRKVGNFAKHADKDPEDVMEFHSFAGLAFIGFAIRGLASLEIPITPVRITLGLWLEIHDSKLVKPNIFEPLLSNFPEEHRRQIEMLPKQRFFETLVLFFAEAARARANTP